MCTLKGYTQNEKHTKRLFFSILQGWVDNFNGPTGLLAAVSRISSLSGHYDVTKKKFRFPYKFRYSIALKILVLTTSKLAILQIGKGVLRIMEGNFHGTADIVPVDLATNLMIAAAQKTATDK